MYTANVHAGEKFKHKTHMQVLLNTISFCKNLFESPFKKILCGHFLKANVILAA
jgi:hypothetical protein